MSKRREQELLMELVELIHEGKITEASNMLDRDEEHKICKYSDERGWTALHFAAQYKQYECALLCIEHGADATVLERFSRTPLDLVNDPSVKKELKEAWESFKSRENATEVAMEEEQRIAAIQLKIRAKMEEEIKRATNAKDKMQVRAELEMAKKAEEAMKITSMEKLLYTLEEKERTIARMRIEFERDLFELQKQLHTAKADMVALNNTNKDHEMRQKGLEHEVETLRAEVLVLRTAGGTMEDLQSQAKTTASAPQLRGQDNKAASSSAPSQSSAGAGAQENAQPDATAAPKQSRFSLGGMFGRK